MTSIGTPLQAHGVRTPEAYLAKQSAFIKDVHAMYPDRPKVDLWVAPMHVAPFVSGSRWVVMCSCGNAPSAHPDWDLACCFECGAIYRDMAWPKDRAAIEAVIVAAPMSLRHWTPAEPLGTLTARLTKERADRGKV